MTDFVARFRRVALAAICITVCAAPRAWAQGQPTATDRAANRAADRAAVRSGDYIVAIVNQELVIPIMKGFVRMANDELLAIVEE
jgi:hypothetical protein